MAVRLQRGRVHRRSQRRGDKVPLPRQYHRDPMDPETRGRHHQRLTSGQDTRSARCGESRTPGAGGGPRETTGGDTGTAPAGLPHAGVASTYRPGPGQVNVSAYGSRVHGSTEANLAPDTDSDSWPSMTCGMNFHRAPVA